MAKYQQAATDYISIYHFFFICGVSAYSLMQITISIIKKNLQILIIRPYVILVVYHTEFQFNFHPSSVVNADIFRIFYMTQQIALE